MNASIPALVLVLFAAALPARAQNAVVAAGKERAANSTLDFEVREATHPLLGPIRFAFLKTEIVTPVGKVKVYSKPYVSCEKGSGKIAIELTHGMSPSDTGGLQPKTVPRLTCSGPPASGEKKLVQEEIPARWGINELGDVLARGLSPSALRQCASINVEQDVALPQAPGTARVAFELTPYSKVMDAIFVTCGEATAWGPGSAPPSRVAATAPPSPPLPALPAPVPEAAPSAAPPPPPQRSDGGWRTVRTIASGKTNVRARPTTDSPVVLQLAPGAIVTVQLAEGDWWRARSSGGRNFDGYIRSDRLVLK